MHNFIFAFIITLLLTGCDGNTQQPHAEEETASLISEENYIAIAQFQFRQLSLNSVSEHTKRKAFVSPHNPTGKVDRSGTNTLQVDTTYDKQRQISGFSVINGYHTLTVDFDRAHDAVAIGLSIGGKTVAQKVMDIDTFTQVDSDIYFQEGDAS